MVSVARVFSVVLCLTIGFAGIAVSASVGTPGDDSSIVAVFPPWWPASRVFAAASEGGAVLNSGTFPFVLVVQSQRPGLGDRLRAAGALLLLNPLGLSGCGPSPPRNQNV